MEDTPKGPSSRIIFLGKLREFLKENFDSGRVCYQNIASCGFVSSEK
jgi:hypothetical protein